MNGTSGQTNLADHQECFALEPWPSMINFPTIIPTSWSPVRETFVWKCKNYAPRVQEPISRGMQPPYVPMSRHFYRVIHSSIPFLLWKKKQLRSSDAVTSITLWWLVMALPRESYSREIRSKNRSVYQKALAANIVQLHVPANRALTCSNNNIYLTPRKSFLFHRYEHSSSTVDKMSASWKKWTPYSKTCGCGIQYRNRLCNNPKPAYNGPPCSGDAFQRRQCYIQRRCPSKCDFETP